MTRSKDALEETARKVQALGRRVLVIELDVTDVARFSAAVDRALTALGRLDVLVNNAGTEHVADSLAVSAALWDRISDTTSKVRSSSVRQRRA